MERDSAGKELAHHRDHIFDLERESQRPVAHRAAGRVTHLVVLQVIACARKQVVIADMIVMHVADDDGLDGTGLDAERAQSVADRLDHLALALLSHRGVEAGIDNDGPRRSYDRPHVVVERLQHVMRIAEDEVFRSFALVVRIPDRIDLVLVVISHCARSD